MTSRPYIEELLGRYAWAHDARDFDALAAVFTEDAQYEMRIKGGESYRQSGRAAIVSQIREFKQRYAEERRHVITNFRYDAESPTRTLVRSYVTVLHFGAASIDIVTAGVYTDEVLQTDGVWLIASKTLDLERGF